MKSILSIFIVLCYFNSTAQTNTTHQADIVIYGGTSSAIVAAVKAKQLGHSVLVVSPDKHLGGVSSSGLGYTDSGNSRLIGGLSKTFYQKVYNYYQDIKVWHWESMEDFHGEGQGTSAINTQSKTMWVFEPHAAEHIFDTWVAENNITVLKEEWLDRNKPIIKASTTIKSFYTLSGKKIEGKIFIDATYEGDLMAAAGVSYHVGRESNAVYNETYNGVQKEVYQHKHNFKKLKISPYLSPRHKESGLLAKISNQNPGKNGDGDHRVEAYCFRMCLTKVPHNRIPISKPEDYNPMDYELLARVYKKGWKATFQKFDGIPNLKTDVNNHGPFSMDNIGMNYDYPEASYEERKAIAIEHRRYQEGLLYFTATDSRVPKKIREEMQKWGYPKDEFTDNGGFPHQLYVREARRMVGDYVMTEHNVLGKSDTNASIGVGSYALDSHNTQRYVTAEGHVENEGDIGVEPPHPYKIDKGTILPKASECTNLIVPVCVSSSHTAYGSIRMEPVFMILGESASQIASLAIQNKVKVQDVNYKELQPLLIKSGQILENK
ncbi:FAD-dependent oxidoreductase [Tamlana agarivorans]|uniref:FAD-dependent oxidoreductase n=1 Tax=Pseudotamlana agarivorans TaxID=481183 RepID=A0ACC5U610_9FLAO|nr:FAD-dependent oxidoreductase [Tamlana agarivorans]MBU2949746.1 FAD-dependent oxidoreductase [Tamlana agarivorans]